MSDEALTFSLSRPIEWEGTTYAEISLREPTAGELRTAVGGENAVAIGIKLVAEVAGIPERAIERLGSADFNRATAWLAPFYARTASDDVLVVNEDRPGTATLTLRKPIRFHDAEHSKIELREPTAGDLRFAAAGDNMIDADIRLLAVVMGVPISVIVGMPAREFMGASRFFSDIGQPTATGSTGS
jgi:hypothetical protein